MFKVKKKQIRKLRNSNRSKKQSSRASLNQKIKRIKMYDRNSNL